MINVEVTGIRELQAQLNKLTDIGATIGPALVASAAELQTWVKEYPPASSANTPRSPGRWYERGKGSMYARRDGTVRVVKASQMLSKWGRMRRTMTPQLAEVVIGPRATYAPYVHDAEQQAKFHKSRGWRTAQEGINKFEPVIVRRVQEAIDKATKG